MMKAILKHIFVSLWFIFLVKASFALEVEDASVPLTLPRPFSLLVEEADFIPFLQKSPEEGRAYYDSWDFEKHIKKIYPGSVFSSRVGWFEGWTVFFSRSEIRQGWGQEGIFRFPGSEKEYFATFSFQEKVPLVVRDNPLLASKGYYAEMFSLTSEDLFRLFGSPQFLKNEEAQSLFLSSFPIEAKSGSIREIGPFYSYEPCETDETKYFQYDGQTKTIKPMSGFLDIEDLVKYYHPQDTFQQLFKRCDNEAQKAVGLLYKARENEVSLVAFSSLGLKLFSPSSLIRAQLGSTTFKFHRNYQDLYCCYKNLEGAQKKIFFNSETYESESLPDEFDFQSPSKEGDVDIKDLLKRKYPHLAFHQLKSTVTSNKATNTQEEMIWGIFRDKENLAVEKGYYAKRISLMIPEVGRDSFLGFQEKTNIFTAKADSVRDCSGGIFRGIDEEDGKVYFSKKGGKEYFTLSFPSGDAYDAIFEEEGKLVFAEVFREGFLEYWQETAEGDICFSRSQNHQQRMIKATSTECGKVFHYLCHYHDDDTGTLQLLSQGKLLPTNIHRVPLTVVDGTKFIVKEEDPQSPIGVLQYREGTMDIDFFINPEANKEKLKFMIHQAKTEGLIPETSLSFVPQKLLLDEKGFLREISFYLTSHKGYGGILQLSEDNKVSVNWCNNEDKSNAPPPAEYHPHPSLQFMKVLYEGQETFYLFSKSQKPSGTTIVMVDGGPFSFYKSSYRMMAHEWGTRMGHTLIFPQETLRIGYGYSHYAKGSGQMGQGNLQQIIDIVYHGLETGLIPDSKAVHLWGHSYGGFVAASFALRFNEFVREERPRFHFKSIISECPSIFSEAEVNQEFSYAVNSSKDFKGGQEWKRKISPLSYAKNPLSSPLLIIMGDTDVRCPVKETTQFSEALSHHPNMAYLKHQAGHEIFVSDEKDLGVKFDILNGWIIGKPSGVTTEDCAKHNIEVIFGKELL